MRIPTVRVLCSLVLVLGLAACSDSSAGHPAGAGASGSATVGAGEPMVIWAQPTQAGAIGSFVETLKQKKGLAIQVKAVSTDVQAEFISASRAGNAPDLVFGDHTWIGNLLAAKAIDPIRLSGAQRSGFNEVAIRAVTSDSQMYAIPYALENVALFRNTELVPDPPRTIEEVVAIGNQLKRAGRVREAVAIPVGAGGDAAAAFPFFTSAGGYLFAVDDDGESDLKDVGLLKPGALTAFAKVGSLGEKGSGALRRSVDTSSAVLTFTTSGAPFLIAPPSALTQIRRAGLGYDICAVPGFYDGKPTQTFITVPAVFLASGGRHKALAQQFLSTYLTAADLPRALYDAQPLPPALTAAFVQVDADDPDMRQLLDAGRGGVILPAIPQLPAILRAFARAEAAVVGGAEAGPTVAIAANEVVAALS